MPHSTDTYPGAPRQKGILQKPTLAQQTRARDQGVWAVSAVIMLISNNAVNTPLTFKC